MRDQPPDHSTGETVEGEQEESVQSAEEMQEAVAEAEWVARARDAFESGRDWIESSRRSEWDMAYALFQNRHPPGSKYHSSEFAGRSRLFRPKIRSAIRQGEAYVAQAFFSGTDIVDVKPEDEDSAEQKLSALVWKEAMNIRLKKHIPWYRFLIGSYQTASNAGFCVGKVYWHYEERQDGFEKIYETDEEGNDILDEEGNPVVLEDIPAFRKIADKPVIDDVAPENFILDPGCDWKDPIGTSPYIVELEPMYVRDVLVRMQSFDPKTGAPEWREYPETIVRTATEGQADTTRHSRERGREDSTDHLSQTDENEIVWIHHNIIRDEGRDWYFLTLGTRYLLTTPVPLEDVFLHGRPYVMGYTVLEAFMPYPTSKVVLMRDLQVEANEITNLALDNAKNANLPFTKVKEGTRIDFNALKRRTFGQPFLVRDENDITFDRPPDMTASLFAHTDRMNADIDELAGNFSLSSVTTSRNMNETVGGMAMMRSQAGGLAEYELTTFKETFVEPLLRMFLKVEQAYETDEVILSQAMAQVGVNPQALLRYGMGMDEVLNQSLTLEINVGLAAMDWMSRMMRLRSVFEVIAGLLGPAAQKELDAEEVVNEVFRAAGYKDGRRFFKEGFSPQEQAMQAEIERLQEELKKNSMSPEEIAYKSQANEQDNVTQLRKEEMKQAGETQREIIRAKSQQFAAVQDLIAQEIANRRQSFVAEDFFAA